ncbi:hypothetical protein CBR_g34775 [Chara braunii]|uniref:Uncharacterized protein n=1 Tax=Chara braunii TaxID=69332 RepID=A0A388LJA2_CHABU|nr:hypothetical protein CBR_g34775 [Chara braunii]|eukprot:GBG82399.1 hypothetical protein CBR_g34775 [Chara braunii]
MGGQDARSKYEALYYSQLVAKPTLLAAGSQAFNWRRHIVDSADAVLYRLGKLALKLGTFPNYIPEWPACGISFNYNAGLDAALHSTANQRQGTTIATIFDSPQTHSFAGGYRTLGWAPRAPIGVLTGLAMHISRDSISYSGNQIGTP